ncbi:MAG: glycosyltransferase family 87 protein [Microbacter sp.]
MKWPLREIAHKKGWKDNRVLLAVWLGTALFVAIERMLTTGIHNNYKIYKYVFWHVLEQTNIFTPHPQLYHDVNNYGPLFSLIIAPFALLPDWIGIPLWEVALTMTLFVAIRQLPLQPRQHAIIYWFTLNSLFTSLTNVQFNIAIVGLIILSFVSIRNEKDIWAALFIVIGTMVKLYGIVGLAFFFFSKHKLRLIGWLVAWSILLFLLPMLISSPSYILNQYIAWGHELILKNSENTVSIMQDMSIMGMIRKTTGHLQWPNMPMIAIGMALFLLPYIRIARYRETGFQLLTLASVLLFTVLFSTGTEPNTFLIGVTGTAIWFVIQPRPYQWHQWIILILVFLFTSMVPSDLFPAWMRDHLMFPYALLSIPCAIAWIAIIVENSRKQSKKYVTTS